jgi:hypothetical protein
MYTHFLLHIRYLDKMLLTTESTHHSQKTSLNPSATQMKPIVVTPITPFATFVCKQWLALLRIYVSSYYFDSCYDQLFGKASKIYSLQLMQQFTAEQSSFLNRLYSKLKSMLGYAKASEAPEVIIDASVCA